jgi:hypothetical protein
MRLSPARPAGFRGTEQIVEPAATERPKDHIGLREVSVTCDRVWNGNTEDAGPLGRRHSVYGVLECDGIRRRDSKAAKGLFVQVGERLRSLDVVGADEGIERVEQAKPLEMSLDPLSLRAGRHGKPELPRLSVRDEVPYSGKWRLPRKEFGLARGAARAEYLSIDGVPEVLLEEVVRRGRIGRRAEESRPSRRRDVKPHLTVDVHPRCEERRLRVENETIKVEDKRANQIDLTS